jgi:ATP/maltotriose-dependent transcriptional regulator MalT
VQVGAALCWLGRDLYRRGDAEAAGPYLEESVALLRAAGDEGGLALALFVRGVIAAEQGDPATAARLLDESRERYARVRDRPGVTYALGWLGYAALRRGDGAAAWGYLEQAAARARTEAAGDLPRWLCFLALLHRAGGDLSTAGARLEESLRLLQAMEHPADAARVLEAVAGLLTARGGVPRVERAARLFGAAAAIRTAARSFLPPADRPDHERDSRAAQDVLGGAYAPEHAAGEAMTIAEALAVALAALAGDAADAPP